MTLVSGRTRNAETGTMTTDDQTVEPIDADTPARILAKRRKVIDRIEALLKEQNETLAILRSAVTVTEKELKEWRELGRRLHKRYSEAAGALHGKIHQFEEAIASQRAILIATSDPVIDEAISFFEDATTELRSPASTYDIPAEAISEALSYIQTAMKTLEETKLEPACDPARIQALREGAALLNVIRKLDVRARARLRTRWSQ